MARHEALNRTRSEADAGEGYAPGPKQIVKYAHAGNGAAGVAVRWIFNSCGKRGNGLGFGGIPN